MSDGHPRPPDRLALFNAKWVEDENGCWIWQGGQNDQGYGTFFDGGTRRAHRWAYETLIGPVPDGLELDHLCHVRLCVNPRHLEAVSSDTHASRRASASHCPHGHLYTPENTVRWAPSKKRRCRECVNAGRRALRRRRREAIDRPDLSA